jgi:hypothetical protein
MPSESIDTKEQEQQAALAWADGVLSHDGFTRKYLAVLHALRACSIEPLTDVACRILAAAARDLQEANRVLREEMDRREKEQVSRNSIQNHEMERIYAERDSLRAQVEAAKPIVQQYAIDNPRWYSKYLWSEQDPMGAHAWLAAMAPRPDAKEDQP